MTQSPRAADPSAELLRFLDLAECSPEDITRPPWMSRLTPLHKAVQKASLDIVRELLDLGADIDMISYGDITPLALAAQYGRAEIVAFLLEAGADPEVGRSPMEMALEYEHPEVAEVLKNVPSRPRPRKAPRQRRPVAATQPQPLQFDLGVLERITRAIEVEHRDPKTVAKQLNAEGIPTVHEGVQWDWISIAHAVRVYRQLSTGAKAVPQGGTLVLEIDGRELNLAITDAVYGFVHSKNDPDLLEFRGECVSLSIAVPREATATTHDFSFLEGRELSIETWSASFKGPFFQHPTKGQAPVVGGILCVAQAEALPLSHLRGTAHGRLRGQLTLEAAESGETKLYQGTLEVAFGSGH